MSGPLLIVGTSGRAAAASALRAGFDPFVIDLFADADTQRLCPVLPCDPAQYPHGLIPLAKQAPPGPWMYTGGLENYPDIVATISDGRELLGNGPDVLRKVRDPYKLGDRVRKAGGSFPETVPIGTTVPEGQIWLCKSLAGAGGGHVRFAKSTDSEPASANLRECLQRFHEGRPMSALFRRTTNSIQLFGLSRQLIGTAWLHAKPFWYSGNITASDHGLAQQMLFHIQSYADEFGLCGCWGTDFLDLGMGTPWTLEVNPRYTSGMEVVELTTGQSVLGQGREVATGRVVGKAIYYAPHRITFPPSGPWDDSLSHCTDVWRRPDFADIPDAGSLIESGQPLFTILAEADSEAECEAELRRRAAEVDRMFGDSEEYP